MKKIFICAILLSYNCIPMFCQGQTSSKALVAASLRIGDPVPDVLITGLKNYSKANVHFSEFRKKLVILDFWMGRCPGCIEAFPKMEALQTLYGDRIQIVMINYESQALIDSNFKKWSRVSSVFRNPRLPSITGDELFHRLFDVRSYPHEVWIDGDGKVLAFTGAEEVNEENITRALNGNIMHVDMKMDYKNFRANKMSFMRDIYPDFPGKLKYYSAFLEYVPGISGASWNNIVDSIRQTLRITRCNYTIFDLFAEATLKNFGDDPLSSPDFDYGKRVIINVKDSNICMYRKSAGLTKGEWAQQYCYTYERVMPLAKKDQLYEAMMDDLRRNFNFDCHVEKKDTLCWALTRTSGLDKLHSTKPALSLFDPKRDTSKFQMYSGTMAVLVQSVAGLQKATPYLFADDTHYSGRVDIETDLKNLSSIDALNKALAKYDLKFVEKVLPLDVLIFTEQPERK